jgi:membrane-associated protease RseP (regulator of RpoE activity)
MSGFHIPLISDLNGIQIALIIIFIYILLVIFIRVYIKPNLEKYSLGFYGPLLMWRTVRGKKTIDKLAKYKKFWNAYATFSIVVVFIAMFLMLGMILLSAYLATQIDTDPVPPENILVLPGLNPIIPLWYGLFALIIAVIIHEFAHGILARVADIKIKSLGMVMFIIPIGAFVEPDEEKLKNTTKLKRDRVFAAGPATNIFVGLVIGLIFAWGFMGSLEPVHDGVLVIDVTEDYPAEMAGILPGMVITHIEGSNTSGGSLGSVEVTDHESFSDFLNKTSVNDTVNVTVYNGEETVVLRNITLFDKGEVKSIGDRDQYKGKGFLGVSARNTDDFINRLAYPVRSADSVGGAMFNLLYLGMFMPLDTTILPFHEPLINVYEPTGSLAAIPEPIFWILANVLYYLFWLNILLGAFNAIPAVPLDGGYPYRDALDTIVKKLRPHLDKDQRESTVNTLTAYTALLILFIFIWILAVPYL